MAKQTSKSSDSDPVADQKALDEANEQAAREPDPTAEPDGDVLDGTLVTDETREGLDQARRNAGIPATSEDYDAEQ
jgi:hypothetical protein